MKSLTREKYESTYQDDRVQRVVSGSYHTRKKHAADWPRIRTPIRLRGGGRGWDVEMEAGLLGALGPEFVGTVLLSRQEFLGVPVQNTLVLRVELREALQFAGANRPTQPGPERPIRRHLSKLRNCTRNHDELMKDELK